MNAFRLLAAAFLAATLMGCQVEIVPLEDTTANQQGSTVQSDSDTGTDNGSDTGTDDDSDTGTDDGSNGGSDTNTSTVTLYWSAPLERVNGETMTNSDIGGYEIRYKSDADSSYTNIVLNEATTDQYSITDLENAESYTFEVAVFDADGIYSEFVVAMAN